MNYITKLQQENEHLKHTLESVQLQITVLLGYYASAKFQGEENNYAHVSTDVYPRLMALRGASIL